MNLKPQLSVFVLLTIAISLFSAGIDAKTVSQTQAMPAGGLAALEAKPLRLYGGVAAGYGNVSSQNEYSAAPDGGQFLLGAALSYQIPKWVFDAGGGWSYSRLSGQRAVNSSIVINTRSGFLDFSPRYRLTESWQFGPVYNLSFGTDTQMGPIIGEANALSLLGARVNYEVAWGKVPFRVILQGLHSVGLENRNIFYTTLGFQVGFPLQRAESARDQLTVRSAAPERDPLNVRKIYFATDSNQIRTEVRTALSKLASVLVQSQNEWEKVHLSGHADIRGASDYNLRLSERRADSVEDILERSGVDSKKIEMSYHGFFQPVDRSNNPDAWGKNRRVEIVFEGVKNPDLFRKLLDQLEPLEIPGEQIW